MKHIKYFLFITLLLSHFPPAYSKSQEGYIETEKYIEITDITNIYTTDIPQKLRKTFNYYAKLDYLKEKDRKKIDKIKGINTVEENIYLKYLLPKKFLVGTIRKLKYPDKDCGKNSYDIVTYIDPEKVELLVVRFAEPNVICGLIIDYDYRQKERKFKNWQDYSEYWI